MKRLLAVLPLLWLGWTGSALAQATWTLGPTGCSVLNSGNASTSMINNCTNGGVAMDAYVFSGVVSGNTASNYVRGVMTNQGTSGIGAGGESAPEHAFDAIGNHEVLVLSFAEAVRLSSLRIGWYQTDSDVQIYRWDGCQACTAPAGSAGNPNTGSPTGNFNPASSGWTLVKTADIDLEGTASGGYNGGTNTTTKDTIAITATTNVAASSWWLVSAYLGAASGDYGQGNDYVKILAVGACTSSSPQTGACAPGTTTTVPEPMSAALVMVALAGGLGARKLRQRA